VGDIAFYQRKLISELNKLIVNNRTAFSKLSSQNENSREHVLKSQMIMK